MRTTIVLQETLGLARQAEPFTVGVPVPKGVLKGEVAAKVEGQPVQSEVLARWGDGSAKWVLLDGVADCPAGAARTLSVELAAGAPLASGPVQVSAQGPQLKVAAGGVNFALSIGRPEFLSQLAAPGATGTLGLQLVLGLAGKPETPAFAAESVEVETAGPRRATVAARFKLPVGLERPLEAVVRVSAFADHPALRIQATLTNPNPAVRAVLGRWPLGSQGAAYLRCFGLKLAGMPLAAGSFAVDPAAPWQQAGQAVRIEQESSGGLHWDIRTHQDRHERVPHRYAGYRVISNGAVAGANFRAEPWVQAQAGSLHLGMGIREFWQNFPVALDTAAQAPASIEFFASNYGTGEHELQGGEAKTWDACLALAPQAFDADASRRLQALCVAPLAVLPAAEALEAAQAEGPFVRRDDVRRPAFEKAVLAMLRDPRRNALTQREVIDEYGWRNYGDLWADNERGCKNAPRESQLVISHYNQEYDWGFGMLYQALRNAGVDNAAAADWLALGRAALRHEADIDTYHVWPREEAQDGVYCGGHFTHTAHGVEPGDATHRGAPTDKYWNTADWPWGRGGGPESGHFHSRGQWLLYYLTGDRRHRDTALECTACVEYKIGADKFAQLDACIRDAGHSLQVLADAFAATQDEKYLRLAEKVYERANFKKQWQEKLDKNPGAGDFSNTIYLRETARLLDVLADHGRAPDAPLYRAALESLAGYLDVIAPSWQGKPYGFSGRVRAGGKPAQPWRPERSNDSWNFIPTNGWLADVFALAARHVPGDGRRAQYLKIAGEAWDTDQLESQGARPVPVYRNSKIATAFCRMSFAAAALTGQ